MKDRIPTYPGRVKLSPVPGQANTYDMERADEPIEAGTALNKANLLTDEVAALIWPDEETRPTDPTPNQALEAILATVEAKPRVEKGSYEGTGTYKSANANILTFNFVPEVLIVQRSSNSGQQGLFIALNGITGVIPIPYGEINSSYGITITWSDNTVSWYSGSNAQRQLNSSGVVYQYLAVG